MGRVLIVLAATALLPAASAAQQPTPDTEGGLLDRYGGYVGLSSTFGEMRGEFAMLVGAELGLVLDRRIHLGVAGSGLASSRPGVELGYGGARVGYAFPVADRLELMVGTLAAGGAVKDESWDTIFVFEPGASAMLAFDRVARLGFGLGYRFVGGTDGPTMSDRDFRGMVGTMTLRFGWF